MSIRFLLNPVAGGGRGGRLARRITEVARGHGAEVVWSRGAEHLREEARRFAADGGERLVAVGGDGTFHQAIQGLAGTGCALGLVPVGTGNDLAACLEIPRHLERALELATAGPVRSIDLGASPAGRFAIYCGLGFDSEVSRWIDDRGPAGKGSLVYVRGVLATLVGFEPPELRVEHDGGHFEGPAMLAVAANAPRFGGGMKIAPAARLDDGRLDLVIIEAVSKPTALRVFPSVFWGGHLRHPAVRVVRTRRARIAADRDFLAYADGEPYRRIGPEGLEIAVEPAALRVAAP